MNIIFNENHKFRNNDSDDSDNEIHVYNNLKYNNY